LGAAPEASELRLAEADASVCNVDRAARLRRLLMILSMVTARPQIRVGELARILKVSPRTVFRDLNELQRLGTPVSFGNGYPAQQELFRKRQPQPISQVVADLVDQQLQVVRRKLPPAEAERVLARAAEFLAVEAAEAVSRAVARAADRPQRATMAARDGRLRAARRSGVG